MSFILSVFWLDFFQALDVELAIPVGGKMQTAFVGVTAADVVHIALARLMRLPAFSVVVPDRPISILSGCRDSPGKKVLFVSRLKRRINCRVIESRQMSVVDFSWIEPGGTNVTTRSGQFLRKAL